MLNKTELRCNPKKIATVPTLIAYNHRAYNETVIFEYQQNTLSTTTTTKLKAKAKLLCEDKNVTLIRVIKLIVGLAASS